MVGLNTRGNNRLRKVNGAPDVPGRGKGGEQGRSLEEYRNSVRAQLALFTVGFIRGGSL